MAHVLVVGGTGMLSNVSGFLAEKGNVVTVIALDDENLHSLTREISQSGGKINPLGLDYTDSGALQEGLQNAFATYGPVQLILSWIPLEHKEVFYHIAQILNRTAPVCRLFQLCGHDWARFMQESSELTGQLSPLNRVLYRKILLGQQEENGQLRWLTHDEISQGIIEALMNDAKTAVIGQMDPLLTGQSMSA